MASKFNASTQKRRNKVEMLFPVFGLQWLRLQGPCGVQDGFILAAAQLLWKLAKP